MAAQPKLLISKKEYEGLIAARETGRNQDLDVAAASAKRENETFRRDTGQAEAPSRERKEFKGLIAATETEENQDLNVATASAKRENEAFRRDMGEAEAPSTEDMGESNSCSSSDYDSQAGEPIPFTTSADFLMNSLPCRRKKRAVKFIRCLIENPLAKIIDGKIFYREKLVGKVPTILQHVFGMEKLGARQLKMVHALINDKHSRQGTNPSRPKATHRTTPKKMSARQTITTRGNVSDPLDINPDLKALIKKYRLNK